MKTLSLAALAVAIAGCQDMPTAPDVAPQLLIGNSPLAPITLVEPAVLRVSTTVSKGDAKVSKGDSFVIRASGALSLLDGSRAGHLDPKVDPVTDPQDADLRDGSDVGIIMDIDIPAPTWRRIEGESVVHVDMLVELVLVTESGSQRVLDAVELANDIDMGLGGY